MRLRTSLPLAFVLTLLLGAATARADDEAVYAKLLAEKAAPNVTVKLVLNVKMNMMGQSQEREINVNAPGVVVDPSGLVMIPNAALNPFGGVGRRGGRGRAGGGEGAPQATPVSIRVVFPGDTKEYSAVLGAKDSQLGLAFVLIRDLGDKKPAAITLSGGTTPRIGQTLYAVTRLGQGYDDAPVVDEAKIVGKVTKPRELWAVEGGGVGRPLYDAAGAVAGIVIAQEGVGEEGGGQRPFLLGVDVAQRTIETSLKQSKEELDRILEEEEEAAARGGDAKKDDEKKDDEKKDDEKKDEGGSGDGK